MERKVIITVLSITVVIVLILLLSVQSTDSNVYMESDGAMFAVTLDGERVTSFPSKGMYRVDVECTNAKGKWDYDDWMLSITDLTSDTAYCNIDFVSLEATTYLNDYITSLLGSEQGAGEIVDENGYRYEGKDPNNYILYNNELWRIIGVFDENTHGVIETNLVKIIRADSIGSLAWHKSGANDWTVASLNSLLNDYYYNQLDGTDSGYCYGYSTTMTATCNYSVLGLDSTYRSMVQSVTWYLGGYSSTNATADSLYEYERSGEYVYSERSTSTTGYIGLMYASDYGYSALESSCARTTYLSSYGRSSCAGQSWLYTGSGSSEWTITSYSGSSGSDFCVRYGKLQDISVYNGYAVRPTLYLSSSVYILDGSGTQSDPYIIGMD